MRTTILLVIFALVGFVAKAQAYTLNPGPVVNGTVVLNDYMFMEIRMVHTGADTLRFEYALLGNTCNPTWEMSMCDYQSCYPLIPNSGTMDPAPAGQDGFLKITMNPHSDGGTGQVRFKVWEASNPSHSDTLTFNIDAVTAVGTEVTQPQFTIYPNPSADWIHIDMGAHLRSAGEFMLYASDGKLAGKAAMPLDGKLTYPVGNLSKGIYLVRIVDRDREYQSRIMVK